ncbi:MAG: hypothetical protein ACFB21_15465 [Opitutales bacterium]
MTISGFIACLLRADRKIIIYLLIGSFAVIGKTGKQKPARKAKRIGPLMRRACLSQLLRRFGLIASGRHFQPDLAVARIELT